MSIEAPTPTQRNVSASTARRGRDESHVTANMVFVPGGTYRTGSDRHYPEETPADWVSVDGFFTDRTPVTNREVRVN